MLKTLWQRTASAWSSCSGPARASRGRTSAAARKNRRITAYTPFTLTGPAAGSDLVKTAADPTGKRVLGTFGNCSGGTTPWGTILSGEENFNGYFVADPTPRAASATGSATRRPASTAGRRSIRASTPLDRPTEPPPNATSRTGSATSSRSTRPIPPRTPRKHTAMGRFKHEGANVRVDRDGTVAAYMGDDERFDYLYKFVAKRKYRPGISAARPDGPTSTCSPRATSTWRGSAAAPQAGQRQPRHGSDWIPLALGGMLPGAGHDHRAGPGLHPAGRRRSCRRPRWTAARTSSPTSDRQGLRGLHQQHRPGQAGQAGPDAPTRGRVTRHRRAITATRTGTSSRSPSDSNKAGATTFDWDLLLVCGDPADPTAATYFGGYPTPVTPISCPDNVAFDSTGRNLWISTDGAPSTIAKPTGCSGSRWPGRAAARWTSSWPCRAERRPAAR